MSATAEDLKAKYSGMTTDELENLLSSRGLTDVAVQTLSVELSSRGVAISSKILTDAAKDNVAQGMRPSLTLRISVYIFYGLSAITVIYSFTLGPFFILTAIGTGIGVLAFVVQKTKSEMVAWIFAVMWASPILAQGRFTLISVVFLLVGAGACIGAIRATRALKRSS